MPQQTSISTENNFSNGYKTEYTALNFPENASTDTQNCVFNRIGNVTRRPGINYEANYQLNTIDRTTKAISTYVWQNAGGDGNTKVLVQQTGNTLYFYVITDALIATPLSTTKLASTVDMSTYVATGGSADATQECQFVAGNGYLFVFRPDLDPFYCTFVPGAPDTVTATLITVQVRDFVGIPEDVADNFRPSTLTTDHNYNLVNQGWSIANPYTAVITPGIYNITVGHSTVFNITSESSATLNNGSTIQIVFKEDGDVQATIVGTVTAHTAATSMTLTITANSSSDTTSASEWTASATQTNGGSINTWKTAVGNYPSNSDVWWTFKDSSGIFNPTTTVANVPLDNAPAPKGYIIMDAFNQQRDTLASLAGITNIITTVRPRTGTWFQGRVWYTGVDASVAASGDQPYTTWTENIYFSQIIEHSNQFGRCYQLNDPTSETFFDLLPSDGGVIVIQGSGSVYKLFPVQNGLLVFAANGVWFITGSQGIGFAANDYTITKISGIRSMSSTSFVDVNGMPIFWNEEGIYAVQQTQAGLQVQPLTFGTIQTFYQSIPLTSLKHVRGVYDPLSWEVRWLYKTTEETSVTDRYQFDGVLFYNTITKAFSPWVVGTDATHPYVNGIEYVQSPGGSTAPDPIIKYLVSYSGQFTFAEENDVTTYKDWTTVNSGINFTSYFVTGYKVRGQGQIRTQTNYLIMYVNNIVNCSYRYQGIWDFAINRSSGKYTTLERIDEDTSTSNFNVVFNRHRVRGRGLVYQFKITSVDGAPFDIIGWSVQDKKNIGL